MLRKSAKRVKHGCTKWRKKAGKGFPFSIPIKIKMTSSNEAERWNEFFNQLDALVDSIKNRRTGDEDQISYLHQSAFRRFDHNAALLSKCIPFPRRRSNHNKRIDTKLENNVRRSFS